MNDYKELREALAPPAETWWYMFDNHTFLKLDASDPDASMQKLEGIDPKNLAYGTLFARGSNRKPLDFGPSANVWSDLNEARRWIKAPAELGPEMPLSVDPSTIRQLLADLDRYRDALERLARLGNGDRLGNSDGNMIARRALYDSFTQGAAAAMKEQQ